MTMIHDACQTMGEKYNNTMVPADAMTKAEITKQDETQVKKIGCF